MAALAVDGTRMSFEDVPPVSGVQGAPCYVDFKSVRYAAAYLYSVK